MENHALLSLSLSPQLDIQGMAVGGQRRGNFSHSGRVTGKVYPCMIGYVYSHVNAYTVRLVNGRIARAAF